VPSSILQVCHSAQEQESRASDRRRTCPGILRGHEADARLHPHGPGRQAVHKDERKVRDAVAAVALHLPGPTAAAHGARGRRRGRGRAQRGHGHERAGRPGMWCARLSSERRCLQCVPASKRFEKGRDAADGRGVAQAVSGRSSSAEDVTHGYRSASSRRLSHRNMLTASHSRRGGQRTTADGACDGPGSRRRRQLRRMLALDSAQLSPIGKHALGGSFCAAGHVTTQHVEHVRTQNTTPAQETDGATPYTSMSPMLIATCLSHRGLPAMSVAQTTSLPPWVPLRDDPG
jgi:hypothetical protein